MTATRSRSRRSCARRPRRGPVRGARLPRPRRPRLDLPRPRPQRRRPLGGAQGSARRRRRRTRWPGDAEQRFLARSSHPSIVSIHNFVQHPGTTALHRDGVRRRPVAEGAPGRPAARRRHLEPLPVPQAIAYALEDPATARLPARPGPGLLRLQARQRHPVRGAAQADRPRRRDPLGRRERPSTARSATRRRRSPSTGPSPGSDLLHCRPHARRPDPRLRRRPASGAPAALPDPTIRCSPRTSRSTGCCSGPPTRTRRRFDSTDEFADQLAACCARCSRWPTARPGPRRPRCSGRPARHVRGRPARRGAPGRPDPGAGGGGAACAPGRPPDPAAAQLAAATERSAGVAGDRPARPRGPAGAGADPARRGRPGRRDRRARRGGRRRSRRLAHRLVPGRRGPPQRPGRGRRRLRPRLPALPGEPPRSSRSPSPRSARATTSAARRYYALLARVEPSLADAAFGLARTGLRAATAPPPSPRSTPCPTPRAGTSPPSSGPATLARHRPRDRRRRPARRGGPRAGPPPRPGHRRGGAHGAVHRGRRARVGQRRPRRPAAAPRPRLAGARPAARAGALPAHGRAALLRRAAERRWSTAPTPPAPGPGSDRSRVLSPGSGPRPAGAPG